MNDTTTSKMFLTTAALAAAAALFAGPANAVLLDVEGGSGTGAPAAAPIEPGTIPYLSHGIGVDESQFAGQPSLGLTGDSALTRARETEAPLTGVHAALNRNRETAAATAGGLDPAIATAMQARASSGETTVEPGSIPYLSHGIGVDESRFSGQPSSGFTGTWPGRVAPAMPEGLTGDSALTRVDPVGGTAGVTSSGDEFDWTWVGYGGGAAVLLAVGLTAIYLSSRRRGGGVALP